MKAKNVARNVGKGVGKGVKTASLAVYNRTFVIAQVTGLILTVVGLVIVVIMSQQKFGLTNLKPLLTMITGAVIALVGIITVGVSYNIRWKRRMIDRVTEIEAHLAILCKAEEEVVEQEEASAPAEE